MRTAYVANKGIDGVFDLCGPTVEFLNSPEETDDLFRTERAESPF
jgi:hypothetical protein